ncbi:metalloregulator ArsR/SmtB family transcription factor [Aliikangiella coralliicola]|uniref:Winged helix-turn-helix transcriptional regulator n=1 Tax=Aliikangiella coralliicola TaxID=2592383 RepID=A0A545UEY0_9GAMM|nr:metalloregulator ArsR/SmtB family transcription factor [Aliikangiella coralliicola]TQV87995.1 winged helix-turn-helix transcriptional regulator [Aliikangiella coralliicola]
MESVFQALSSTVRRKILAYLSKTSLTAGEIADRFEISKPALSKHLNVLMNAGLIESDKQGQYVHYRLVKNNLFASMNDFLVNFCPEGRPLKMESAEIEAGKKSNN